MSIFEKLQSFLQKIDQTSSRHAKILGKFSTNLQTPTLSRKSEKKALKKLNYFCSNFLKISKKYEKCKNGENEKMNPRYQ